MERESSKECSVSFLCTNEIVCRGIQPCFLHECVAEFRVRKRDIPLLGEVLQIPEVVICNQRGIADGKEALCMLLKRLAYHVRYSDMVPRFARPVPVLSMITNEVLDHVYRTHQHRICQWYPEVMNPLVTTEIC